MKIIFLDFDGVLNSVTDGIVHRRQAYRACTINKTSFGLLKWVTNVTGAKIVISSTWRSMGVDWIKGVFEAHGWIMPPIIDRTTLEGGGGGHRGSQVEQYLQDMDESEDPLEEYVCIDDDSDFFDYQPLVKTDPNLGFTVYDAIRVIDILGEIKGHDEHGVKGIREHVDFQLEKQGRTSSKLKVDEDT